MPNIYTNTYTYTKPRTEVIRDQFEVFLRYTGMVAADRDKLLASIERGELAAIGAFLEKDGYRFMEVELEIDWKFHAKLKRAEGDKFDTDLPGWEEYGTPEVNKCAQQISRIARDEGLRVRHCIRVIDQIISDPTWHQALCESLGYSFGSTLPPWRGGSSREKKVNIIDLPEMGIYEREAGRL